MAALSNLKILDFSTLLPGPFGTLVLADLGAQVLRVEAPDRMDLTRYLGAMDGDASFTHRYLNRSKKSLGLNLKSPEAIAVVKDLIKENLSELKVGLNKIGLVAQKINILDLKDQETTKDEAISVYTNPYKSNDLGFGLNIKV